MQHLATPSLRMSGPSRVSSAFVLPYRVVVQAAIKQVYSAQDVPCVLFPYLLWSDGSQLTNDGKRFHPVNIVPANWPLELMRGQSAQKLLALMPVVESAHG